MKYLVSQQIEFIVVIITRSSSSSSVVVPALSPSQALLYLVKVPGLGLAGMSDTLHPISLGKIIDSNQNTTGRSNPSCVESLMPCKPQP